MICRYIVAPAVLLAVSYIAAHAQCMSDSQLDTLFGLGGATVPQFVLRPISGVYGGSFNGTSLHEYNGYAGQLAELSSGTSASPNTTVGPILKISRTGTPAVGNCANLADSECTTAVAFYANSPVTTTTQTTALVLATTGGGSAAGTDLTSLWVSARGTNATGAVLPNAAYFESRRDFAGYGLKPVEIRSANNTATNCSYYTAGQSNCVGIWATSQGDGIHAVTTGPAFQVGTADGFGSWYSGLTFNSGASVANFDIDDESTSTTGIQMAGTHTYSFISAHSAGNVGIGTLTPANPLVVATTAAGIVETLTNSAGTCSHTPGASSETVACSSDVRMKEDIHNAKSALEYFGEIHVREFKVKATGEIKTGVIAQEMLQNYGSMVHMGTDGFYTVDEPNPWMLVKAIQEQQIEIQKQQDEIAQLRDFLRKE